MWNLTPDEASAISLSLKVAAMATVISLPAGVFAALLLARSRFPGKVLFEALLYLPLVLPPVVTGYYLLLIFGRQGPIGALLESTFGLVLSFRWTGAVLAAAVMAFPLLVRAIRLSIEAIDARVEEAASTLGASPFWVFLTVTLPLALPGILAGATLCFAKALGEFGATITFVANIPGETQTLAGAIYVYTQQPGGDASALRLSAAAVVISLAALVASDLLARRWGARAQ